MTDPTTPPHDRAAECGVLGGIIRDPETFWAAAPLLAPGAFYFDAHQRVYAALQALVGEQAPIDLVTVADRLRKSQSLADVGGAAYLADLWDAVPTGALVEYHARLVADAAKVRGLIYAANEILRDAFSPTCPADELLARAERAVMAVGDTGGGVIHLRHSPEVLRDALERIDARIASGGGLAGLPTGYADLDDLLGGLGPGQVIVVGARPSCGKTALGLSLAVNVATRGHPVAFFSLEMPESEIAGRLLAMGSGVAMHRISRGARLDDTEVTRLVRAASPAGLGGAPLYLSDVCDLSATAFGAALRRATRRHGIGLAVVDYLQLLRPENPKDNRVQQVGLSARMVKRAARECGVPVLLLCQLNREVENRNNGRPRLADLRESGEIEQHADAVLLLHPHPNQPSENTIWQTDVIVGKNRNGPVGDVTLAYRRPVMRFESSLPGAA